MNRRKSDQIFIKSQIKTFDNEKNHTDIYNYCGFIGSDLYNKILKEAAIDRSSSMVDMVHEILENGKLIKLYIGFSACGPIIFGSEGEIRVIESPNPLDIQSSKRCTKKDYDDFIREVKGCLMINEFD